ncbi:MAG: hypothetical protein ACRDVZ_13325 [Jiangellaceae bacterium]
MAEKLVGAQSLMCAVWADNRGDVPGDSVIAVRLAGTADRILVKEKWNRLNAELVADGRSEDEIEAAILAELGL